MKVNILGVAGGPIEDGYVVAWMPQNGTALIAQGRKFRFEKIDRLTLTKDAAEIWEAKPQSAPVPPIIEDMIKKYNAWMAEVKTTDEQNAKTIQQMQERIIELERKVGAKDEG